MIQFIIFSVISVIALIFSFLEAGVIQKIITCGLFLGVIAGLSKLPVLVFAGAVLVFIMSLLAIVYPLIFRDLTKFNKFVIIVFGAISSISILFSFNNYPYQSVIKLFAFIPLIIFPYFIFRNLKQLPSETGFLLMLATMSSLTFFMAIY